MKRKIFVGMILLTLCSASAAQSCSEGECLPPVTEPSPCPDGISSAGQCIPPYADPRSNAYQGDAPLPPRVIERWESRWGAIALDGSLGIVGKTTGQASQPDAEQAALKDCTDNGGKRCGVELAYSNSCGAIISGDHNAVTENGRNVDEATEIAMRACTAVDTGCHVYYVGCSPAAHIVR